MVLLGAYHTPNAPKNASCSNNSDTIFYSIMGKKANKKQKFGKNSNNVTQFIAKFCEVSRQITATSDQNPSNPYFFVILSAFCAKLE